MTTLSSAAWQTGRRIGSRAAEWVGGPARLEVILLLAAILGLDSAEKAAVSAVAGELKRVFSLNNTDIGILVAATSLIGALFTLPVGTLVDRLNRKTVVLAAIALWTTAVVVSGMASSFTMLLVTRMFLGAVTAAAAPTVASLVGDFFPPEDRARAYGAILGGELVGIGIGFSLSGEVSTMLGWRWSFYLLGIPSAAIGVLIWRFLPEPARGGQAYIRVGQEELTSKSRDAAQKESSEQRSRGSDEVHERIRSTGVQPRRELVIRENPARWSIWTTMGYLLRIPTYRLLVIASALGYFFFAGVRAFGMIFITSQYGLSRGIASVLVFVVGGGALIGVIASGKISSWLFAKGWLDARIIVPGVALFSTVLLTVPAIWTNNAIVGFAFLTFGSAFLAAANPPLDAARLDIVHARLWGRAEAGRMALRGLLEGIAPILFGWVSGVLGGGNRGLDWTFMIMLVPVLAASTLAIPARRTYPADVATADASARAIGAE
jgi:predicted MFS family arabinose efflux permease